MDLQPPPNSAGSHESIVAGLMSGTSADGIDVALCRIVPAAASPRIELIRHCEFPYPAAVRASVLHAMSDAPTTVPEMARLNWRLGALYADAVRHTCGQQSPDLVGLHGQTIFHQATAEPFLDAPVRATWQTGEPAVLAERLRVPVVSDFRTADLAAGGQGAPLVPVFDFHFFRHPAQNRILLNLGGIANVSLLPAGCRLEEVLAFDTGPANMVMDALAAKLLGLRYDPGGEHARRGHVLPALLSRLLSHPYFTSPAPKSCGREQFGEHYAAEFLALAPGAAPEDLLATAAELTAHTVTDAIFALQLGDKPTEVIASGGGTRNPYLLGRLRALLLVRGIALHTTDECGLPSQAKEAAAFALLAWLTWHRLPGNVPSATGARHPAILGRITCV